MLTGLIQIGDKLDINNQIELELYFSEHFDTILFPVLAEMYLKNKDLKRARKVCDIGFNYHENDISGWFVYAKIEKAEGNLKEVEKALEKVLLYSNNHIAAAEMLCEVQTVLGRSPNRILKSWKHVLKLNPMHQTAIDFIQKVESTNKNIQSKPQNSVSPKSSVPKQSTKKTSFKLNTQNTLIEKSPEPLKVSPSLATFTLVSVLKNQGLFDQALDVLDHLEKKGENTESINIEREIIQTLIKKSNKD